MSIKNKEYSTYIDLNHKAPFKGDFKALWLTIVGSDSQLIASSLIKKDDSLRSNLVAFFKSVEDIKDYQPILSELSTVLFQLKMKDEHNNCETLTFTNDKKIIVSEVYDKETYDCKYKIFEKHAKVNTTRFFEDLKKEYELSENELLFLIPSYKDSIVQNSFLFDIFVKEIELYCKARNTVPHTD